jgi:cytochrome c oxidase cbb3-type subunit 3
VPGSDVPMETKSSLTVTAFRAFAVALWFIGTAAVSLPAQDTHQSVDERLSRPFIRGGVIFKTYCVLCHGERADGVARAAKLYGGVKLAIKPDSPHDYGAIIRKGSNPDNAAKSMPPFGDELSDAQITDVLAYLNVLHDPVSRGEFIFMTNCVLCHGVHGDGKGHAAILYEPPPADLTRSTKSDVYKEAIIRFGGAWMRRSPFMPAWNHRLTNTEIQDVVAYLRTLLPSHHAR